MGFGAPSTLSRFRFVRSHRARDGVIDRISRFTVNGQSVEDLAERFARAERQGLIDIVRSAAEMPIADLLALIESGRTGRLLGTLTLAECHAGLASERAPELHDKARSRAAYDARILDELDRADEPLSPVEIRERVGGTAQDARTALQRLTAAKKITRTPKARGHGYQLPGRLERRGGVSDDQRGRSREPG